MSDLRGALAISNDVHAELMEAVRDGREPARVAAAAAARRVIVPPARCMPPDVRASLAACGGWSAEWLILNAE